MKRAACVAIALAACLAAQSGRDAYRAAYRNWREADPGLDRDAAAGGADVADRAGRKAELAGKYGAARSTYLQQLAAGDEASRWIEGAVPLEPRPGSADGSAYVAAETALVSRTIEAFANDPDRGIQKVRQSLERERVALAALSGAIGEQQKAADAAREAASAGERAWEKAITENRDLIAGLTEMAGHFHQETEAWGEYYRNLGESVSAAAESAQPPAPEQGGTEQRPGARAADAPAPRTAPAALRPLVPSITPVPLVRYTGAWTFPAANGIYHGPQPEFIDLVVNEENGHARGTLLGRFKLPPGSAGDPVLKLDFEGDFKSSLNQTFDLATSSGAKGTMELIPGDAFNLLEVNLRIDAAPAQIAEVHAVLIKK